MSKSLYSLCLFSMVALSACGGSTPAPAPARPVQPNSDIVAQEAGLTVRANAVQTSALNEAVARRYGIARNDRTVMLLVGVRRGGGEDEISVPARVTVAVGGLAGGKQPVEMRELRTGDPSAGSGHALLDYVGTVETALPDTLRFDIRIATEDGVRAEAQFTREFYPR